MTLRRKIVLSNVLMVVLPIVLILVIWTGYVRMGSGAYLKPINRSADGGDRLTEAMNILYTYEAELSDMNWDVVAFPDEQGVDVVVSPEKERIEELKSLGYHIEVESPSGVSFSNMDDTDLAACSDAGAGADGAIYWAGKSLIIRDSFRISGQTWNLTAVYNGDRVDQGVQSSLIPMYMVSPMLIALFLAIAAGCIAVTSTLVSRWMGRSILVPLKELKKGADMVAKDDLDYRIPYEGKDEFGEVCEEFDRMRLELRDARGRQRQYEEERRELLRGISHDLRSPLTSIKGYAMGLKDGIANTEEKKQRYYDAILTRADDMERLTGSLSLLVRLENDAGMLRPEKVCLDEYISQLLAEKKAWLLDRHVEVFYRTEDADAEVNLDIREMQRVFMNLFENTVRYRIREDSKVKILVRPDTGFMCIDFSDDGPGVSKNHLSHIFDSFYRADTSRTNPEKGSGIGLAVVRRVIEGQGGSVSASSDHGLCITMTIPLARE